MRTFSGRSTLTPSPYRLNSPAGRVAVVTCMTRRPGAIPVQESVALHPKRPIAAQPNISASLLERRLQSRSSRVPDRPTLPMTVRGRDREGHVRSAPGPAAGKETDHAQDLQLQPSVAPDPHRRGRGSSGAACRALTRASSDRLRAPAIAPAIRAVLQVHPLAARQGRGVPRADPTLRRNHGMAGGGCSSLDLGTKLTRPAGDVSFISPERVYPPIGGRPCSPSIGGMPRGERLPRRAGSPLEP